MLSGQAQTLTTIARLQGPKPRLAEVISDRLRDRLVVLNDEHGLCATHTSILNRPF